MSEKRPGSTETVSPPQAEAVVVSEIRLRPNLPIYAHPVWLDRFPWLLQATTGRQPGGDHDLSFFTGTPAGQLFDRWRALRTETDFPSVVHARQVHGADVIEHAQAIAGFAILDDADGHMTSVAGLLMTVSVADCVPISLVDERTRAVALLHAGWRGVAANILERGVRTLIQLRNSAAADLHCHLGPAICGRCYEVGPEVHRALGLEPPGRNMPIDLRALLVPRAAALGLPVAQITRSAFCTRCNNALFFSHRAGDRGRQMGLLGIRAV